MTKSTNKILNIIEFIKYAEETLELIENTRSKVYNEVINTIHRLTNDMHTKIFDEILKRARYLWGSKE